MLRFKDFSLILENKTRSDSVLKKDFDYINKLLFDNQVKDVPVNYFHSKTKAGVMEVKKGKISIKITRFFELSEPQRRSIMAHEMIHALMTQNDIPDNNDHGKTFMKIVSDMNKKQDEFVISKSEQLSEIKPASKNKKPLGVIVFKINKDDIGGVFVDDKIINDRKLLNEFCDNLKEYTKLPQSVFKKAKTIKLEFWKCDDPYLSKFKIKRTLSLISLEINNISANELKTIETGKKLFERKIK